MIELVSTFALTRQRKPFWDVSYYVFKYIFEIFFPQPGLRSGFLLIMLFGWTEELA
jgi:hypothetical protein